MSFDQERFIQAIKDKKLTNQDLIDRLFNDFGIEITIDGIKAYRRKDSKIRTPSLEKLTAFSKILDISVDELAGIKTTPVKQVPIIGGTSCGAADINYSQEENKKANYNGEFWTSDLYCVIANGDSMSPEIEDGDEIIIDPRVKPVHGDMVHYKIDGESAVKLLTRDEEAYIMQFIPYNQSEDFKIKTVRLDDKETLDRLSIHKVVSVNKLKYNNRLARLRLIGRA